MTTAAMVSLRLTLEAIARCTWRLLEDATSLGASIGEETLTDLLAIRVKRDNHTVTQFTKASESRTGVDIELEVWLGNARMGWTRLAIQAKKLDVRSRRYRSLDHKNSTGRQIDMLEKYAKHWRAIPLYLLYNWKEDAGMYWHCSRPLEIEQMGCTVAPLIVIKRAIQGSKRFNDIHRNPSVFPLGCLAEWPVCCNSIGLDSLYFDGITPQKHGRIHDYLQTGDENFRNEFLNEFHDAEVGLPRRIMVLNVPEEDPLSDGGKA